LWMGSAGHQNGRLAFRKAGQNGIPNGLSERETRDRRSLGFEGPAAAGGVRFKGSGKALRKASAQRASIGAALCFGRDGIERMREEPRLQASLEKVDRTEASASQGTPIGTASASAGTGSRGCARASARASLEKVDRKEASASQGTPIGTASASAGTRSRGCARASARASLEKVDRKGASAFEGTPIGTGSASAGTGSRGSARASARASLERRTGRELRLSEGQPGRIGWARPS